MSENQNEIINNLKSVIPHKRFLFISAANNIGTEELIMRSVDLYTFKFTRLLIV